MKSKIATALFTMTAALGFSQEALIEQPSSSLPLELKPVEKIATRQSYGYVRMGISDNDAIHTFETLPGAGLGYRFAVPSASIDVSANYTRQFGEDNYFYTVPQVSYLRYVSAAKEQSFYYGVGAAWGVLNRDETNFKGLVGSATVGYEMNRNSTIRSFVQLQASQPAVAVASWKEYSVSDLPTPIAEISFGLGY